MNISLPAGCRFRVRSYCVREQCQVSPCFPLASATVSLHTLSRTSKMWVSRSCRRLHTCLMLTVGRSLDLHVKRPALPKKLKRASQKGKKLKIQTFQDHASKKNDNRRRKTGRHKPFPEFPQDRECARHEEALLRAELPSGTLWRLHL